MQNIIFRILGSLSLIVIFSWGQILAAADNVNPFYVIDDVKVEAKADSALKAQEQAIEQAKIKAFQRLVEQKLNGKTMSITAAAVENLVLDYEVLKQKQSAYSYKATLRVRFNEEATNKYIGSHKAEEIDELSSEIPPTAPAGTDKKAEKITGSKLVVIPVLKDKNGKTKLWGEGNPWYSAWADSTKLSTLNELVVPIGDLSDITELPLSQINNPEHLNGLARKYNAQGALLAIVEEQPDGSFKFSGNVQRLNNDNKAVIVPPQAEGTYKTALTHFIAELDKNSPAAVAPVVYETQTIDLNIPIATLKDWLFIKNLLAHMPGVKTLKLKSMSTKTAAASLTFNDSIDNLNLVLESKGFKLNKREANGWEIARINPKHLPY